MIAKQTIERKRAGRGFEYFYNDQRITNKEEVAYLKSLGIPPAWQDVHISKHKKAKILATGLDKAGRTQAIYSPSFRAKQDREKFERILRFARALPRMRRTTAEHLNHPKLDQEKVLACVVRLMDRAYFRVGNEIYAKENQTYGLTTLRNKHTDVKGDTMIFNFVGKSGKEHEKTITDKKLAKIVKKLEDLPGYEIFKYYDEDGKLHPVDSGKVNEYIKEVMGDEFSAKDFRTWGGTLLAAAELAAAERSHKPSERKHAVNMCVKNVALKLGNTPTIARASYIDPRVISAYLDSDELRKVRGTVEHIDRISYLSADEHCVLNLLEQRAGTK